MNELWRPVAQFPDYEVSSLGRVRRLTATHKNPAGFKLSAHPGRRGHLAVNPYLNGRRHTVYVHRLVALAFVDGDHALDVLHRDGDPSNNAALNLYWGTDSDNQHDAVRHGVHGQASKTHCPAGHSLTGANLYEHAGERFCRACRAEQSRAYRERKRGERR